jgi:hypothetical protein
VLLRFDNIPVANEGTVPFRAGERISFGFLVSQKYCLSTLASILLVYCCFSNWVCSTALSQLVVRGLLQTILFD